MSTRNVCDHIWISWIISAAGTLLTMMIAVDTNCILRVSGKFCHYRLLVGLLDTFLVCSKADVDTVQYFKRHTKYFIYKK